MTYIKKIIYNDDTELELGEIEPMGSSKGLTWGQASQIQQKYLKQFDSFDLQILNALHQNIVEDFSKNEYDLIHEDDCECPETFIKDFSNQELIDELIHSDNIIIQNSNLRQDALIKHFLNLIKNKPLEEVEKMLSYGN